MIAAALLLAAQAEFNRTFCARPEIQPAIERNRRLREQARRGREAENGQRDE